MLVKEAVEELLKQDQEAELFMFYKTKDGKLTFSSEIGSVAKGAVYDEYGNLKVGVLMEKE